MIGRLYKLASIHHPNVTSKQMVMHLETGAEACVNLEDVVWCWGEGGEGANVVFGSREGNWEGVQRCASRAGACAASKLQEGQQNAEAFLPGVLSRLLRSDTASMNHKADLTLDHVALHASFSTCLQGTPPVEHWRMLLHTLALSPEQQVDLLTVGQMYKRMMAGVLAERTQLYAALAANGHAVDHKVSPKGKDRKGKASPKSGHPIDACARLLSSCKVLVVLVVWPSHRCACSA
eukprot:333996-Pelagomonas_calceolata.AAC.7